MQKNSFITGGNGYIGNKLLKTLVSSHSVTVFDKTTPQTPIAGVKYIEDDLKNIHKYCDEINSYSTIIHLSSTALPNAFEPALDIQNDLLTTISLLDQIRPNSKVKHFMYLSSGGAVYGNSNGYLEESSFISPISSYGVVKNCIEHYVRLFSTAKNITFFIARPGNVFGPGIYVLKQQNVVSNFLLKIKKNIPIEIWGDGESRKDYIHINDLSAILKMALDRNICGTYNIASGNTYSVNEIIDTIREMISTDFKIKNIKQKNTDVNNALINGNKIKELLGYKDFISLEKGIEEIWNDLNQLT
jgi:UDP-glucose 4-epimerase